MLRLIEKLINRLAKIGLVGIEGANEELRDSEQYIRKVSQKKGADKFQYASKYIRSDAEFILSMVKDYPEILEHCNSEIYDRYMKDCFMVEEELLDMLIFADLCYQKNDYTLYYFPDDIVCKYLKMLENGETIKGFYNGKPYEHKLSVEEKDLFWLSMCHM